MMQVISGVMALHVHIICKAKRNCLTCAAAYGPWQMIQVETVFDKYGFVQRRGGVRWDSPHPPPPRILQNCEHKNTVIQ